MSSFLIKHITGLTVPLCQIVSTNTIIRKGEIKMRIIPAETQCMIIDMQEKLVPAMFNKEACEDRVCMLARGLNLLEIPMLITQQYTKGLGGSLPSVCTPWAAKTRHSVPDVSVPHAYIPRCALTSTPTIAPYSTSIVP